MVGITFPCRRILILRCHRGLLSKMRSASSHALLGTEARVLKRLARDVFGEGVSPGRLSAGVAGHRIQDLRDSGNGRTITTVKSLTYREVKAQEGRSRVAAVRQARRSAQAANLLQRRASLVGSGSRWRITNLRQVARAMAEWA